MASRYFIIVIQKSDKPYEFFDNPLFREISAMRLSPREVCRQITRDIPGTFLIPKRTIYFTNDDDFEPEMGVSPDIFQRICVWMEGRKQVKKIKNPLGLILAVPIDKIGTVLEYLDISFIRYKIYPDILDEDYNHPDPRELISDLSKQFYLFK